MRRTAEHLRLTTSRAIGAFMPGELLCVPADLIGRVLALQANRRADLVRQICSSVIAQALPASMVE